MDEPDPALRRREQGRPRIGILAERGAAIFTWDATRAALEAAGASLIYLEEHPTNAVRRSPELILDRLLWRVVTLAENRLTNAPRSLYRPLRPVVLPCAFRGRYKLLPDGTIEALRALDLDVVIRLGGRGIYRGAILDVAPGGSCRSIMATIAGSAAVLQASGRS